MRVLLSAIFLVCFGVLPAMGQVTQSDLDAVNARIDQLEKQTATQAGSYFTLYGFVRLDAQYDTAEANDSQVIMFIPSQDPASGNKTTDDGFTLYTRLTRLGIQLKGPEVHGMPLAGRIEVDFYGGGSESRHLFRMRHAFLTLRKNNLEFLLGQTSDLFSPLFPSLNWDSLFWNAGNTGDRRPQARVTYNMDVGEKANVSIAAALALQGAVDNNNGDADGYLDGEDGGLPQLQVRVGYSRPLLAESKTNDFGIGVWAVRGKDETDVPIGGNDDYDSKMVGLDLMVPIIANKLDISGEWWTGKNLDDLRGGIGQGINAVSGEEINATGFWFQGRFRVNDANTVVAGYSEDNPANHDLTAGGAQNRARNQVYFLGYTNTHFNPITLGFEYSYWETNYVGGLRHGTNHHFKTYFMYKF